MKASEARAMLRHWHATAMPVFEVSARGRVYRVLAENKFRAIQRGMELYSDEFGGHAGSSEWTVRQITHVTH